MVATLFAVLLYLQENRLMWLVIACLLSIGSFLIRQPGILLMPILGIWICFEKTAKKGSLITFLLLTCLGVGVYLGYEKLVKPLIGISDNFVPVSSLYFDAVLEEPLSLC